MVRRDFPQVQLPETSFPGLFCKDGLLTVHKNMFVQVADGFQAFLETKKQQPATFSQYPVRSGRDGRTPAPVSGGSFQRARRFPPGTRAPAWGFASCRRAAKHWFPMTAASGQFSQLVHHRADVMGVQQLHIQVQHQHPVCPMGCSRPQARLLPRKSRRFPGSGSGQRRTPDRAPPAALPRPAGWSRCPPPQSTHPHPPGCAGSAGTFCNRRRYCNSGSPPQPGACYMPSSPDPILSLRRSSQSVPAFSREAHAVPAVRRVITPERTGDTRYKVSASSITGWPHEFHPSGCFRSGTWYR